MGFYDSEVERQKQGSTAANIALPILAAIETIATAKATRGQNVGTSTLNLYKDVQNSREAAINRAMQRDAAQPGIDLQKQQLDEYTKKDQARKDAINRYLGLPGISESDKADIQTDPYQWQKDAPDRQFNAAASDPEVGKLLSGVIDAPTYNAAKVSIMNKYGVNVANKILGSKPGMPMEKFSVYEGGLPGGPVGGYVVNSAGQATPIVPKEPGTGMAGTATPPAASGDMPGMAMPATPPAAPPAVNPPAKQLARPVKETKSLEEIAAEAAARAAGSAKGGQAGGKAPTDDQSKSANFARRMELAMSELEGIKKSGYDPTSLESAARNSKWAPNFANTGAGQQYENSKKTFVRANLRKESGAVIGDQEMADEMSVYFPVYGDSPETVAQKELLRAQAFEGMKAAAGKQFDVIPSMIPPKVSPGAALNQAFPAPTAPDGTERINAQGVKMKMTGGKWQIAQ